MESTSQQSTSHATSNVVSFGARRSRLTPRRDQKSLMEAVYAAGSLAVDAQDRRTKEIATRLTIFGLVTIEEVLADGSARRLRASEAFSVCTRHPWRVARPQSRYALRALPESDADLFAAPG